MAITLWTPTGEALGSNLGRQTDYPDGLFVVLSVPLAKYRDGISVRPRPLPNHISFINHPTIRRYVVLLFTLK
jgi:hypothetical protein